MSLNKFSHGDIVLPMRHQQGFSLFGTVIAMIVAAMMLTMMAKWMNEATDDMRAKRNADSLLQFTQVAGHYLDANREAIMRVMNAETVAAGSAEAALFCVVSLNGVNRTTFTPYKPATHAATDTGTCAVDAQWLVSRGMLPTGFAVVNPYGQKWVAIYRLVYADYDNNVSTPNTTQFDVEMLVVATAANALVPANTRATPNNELGMTIQLVGGIAGMYPDTANAPVATCPVVPANTGTQRICGPGGWQVDPALFAVTYQ
ncbi:hypothetical protein BH11PSE12_BH11PSE12_32550 [soil metagenome]